jgi:maltose O-acetyltransferase
LILSLAAYGGIVYHRISFNPISQLLKVMMRLFSLLILVTREAFSSFAEMEVRVSKPNDYLLCRRIYFILSRIKFEKNIWVGRNFFILRPGNLILGHRCAIGEFSRIENHALVSIGDDFLSAPGLVLNSGGHDPITLQPYAKPISIGHRVWCGINVSVLAGVNIGDDVVIGAGSLVCSNIPSNSIALGVPARVIKPLNRDAVVDLWTWATP